MVDFQYDRPYSWEALLEIMRLLRQPDGCPWDRVQTHDSIRRNFLEETYEVLDALDRDSADDMCEELGDVLLQVVFHAQIEAERGRFNMEDVVDGIAHKLVFRHPHVFGSKTADSTDQALNNWESQKVVEKGQKTVSDTVEAVPHTLPALWRAEKECKRATKGGFQFPDKGLSSLEEAVAELKTAGGNADKWQKALGDVMFASAKLAQRSGVDPEEALHQACDRFAAHFRMMEESMSAPMEAYSPEEQKALWDAAQ